MQLDVIVLGIILALFFFILDFMSCYLLRALGTFKKLIDNNFR